MRIDAENEKAVTDVLKKHKKAAYRLAEVTIEQKEKEEKMLGSKTTFSCWYDGELCSIFSAARGMAQLSEDSVCLHCGRVDKEEILKSANLIATAGRLETEKELALI